MFGGGTSARALVDAAKSHGWDAKVYCSVQLPATASAQVRNAATRVRFGLEVGYAARWALTTQHGPVLDLVRGEAELRVLLEEMDRRLLHVATIHEATEGAIELMQVVAFYFAGHRVTHCRRLVDFALGLLEEMVVERDELDASLAHSFLSLCWLRTGPLALPPRATLRPVTARFSELARLRDYAAKLAAAPNAEAFLVRLHEEVVLRQCLAGRHAAIDLAALEVTPDDLQRGQAALALLRERPPAIGECLHRDLHIVIDASCDGIVAAARGELAAARQVADAIYQDLLAASPHDNPYLALNLQEALHFCVDVFKREAETHERLPSLHAKLAEYGRFLVDLEPAIEALRDSASLSVAAAAVPVDLWSWSLLPADAQWLDEPPPMPWEELE